MLYETIQKKEEGTYYLTSVNCPDCETALTIEVPSQNVFLMNQGGLVTSVLPDEPADVRERFISGICGDCWNNLFGVGEDQDE